MSKKNYFRFIPSNSTELEIFCRKVIPNYLNKTLQVDMVDSINGEVHRWIEDISGNVQGINLKLELYNDDGDSTVVIEFFEAELLDHEFPISYDAEGEEQRSHSLLFSYHAMKRNNVFDN